MALDVTANPRNWYYEYKKQIVGGHARTVHRSPDSGATESVTSLQRPRDANDNVFPVEYGSMENGGKQKCLNKTYNKLN